MNEKIIMVKVSDIQDHPQEKIIYGDVNTDHDFVASIEDQGVLQPVILADVKLLPKKEREKDTAYFLVSGHRRVKGSVLAGIREVPAMIGEYKNYNETTLHLCLTNKNREKTNAQRVREFMASKQILSQLGKLKQSKGTYSNTIYEDEEFLRILKNWEIDEDEPLNTIEILKEASGFSEWEQRMIKTVHDDDYMEKQLKKLKKMKLSVEAENNLANVWISAREKVEKDECSLSEAYNAISKLLSDLEKKLNPKPKKAKAKKQKEETESSLFEVLPQFNYTYSQTPQKYDPNPKKSTIDFVLKSKKGADIGVVKTNKMPVGVCVKLKGSGVNYMLDFDELAAIIADEIS